MVQNILECEALNALWYELFTNDDPRDDEPVEFLNIIWRAMQFVDDKHDGHTPKTSAIMFFNDIFNKLPRNKFYCDNIVALNNALSVMALKWHAANENESIGKADQKTFMWRAGYYDLVLAVYVLHAQSWEHATENANFFLSLYGEKYETYLKEFE